MVHNIRQKCKEKGITLAELERQVGVAPKGIYRWDTQDPAVHKVLKVARILDTTVEELCREGQV